MGFCLPGKQTLFSKSQSAWKGVAVYVGEKMKRFMIPISMLNQPLFQELLRQVEDEFSYDHPMGGLAISCIEHVFVDVASHFNEL